MPTSFSNMLFLLGFGSSAVGFSRFAQRPSLQKLFRQWDLLKIVVCYVVSFMFSVFLLFANCIQQPFPRDFLKTQVSFLALMLIYLYSHCEGRRKQEETGEKGYWSMVGVVVAVLCYAVLSIRSYSEHRRRGGAAKQHDIVVMGDSSHEETPPILSPLSLTIHPNSLTTPRRRPVNLDSSSLGSASEKHVMKRTCDESCRNLERLVPLKVRHYYKFCRYMNPPAPILASHVSLKTLNCVSLSAVERHKLESSGWDFTKALPHLRFLNFWLPERALLLTSNVPCRPQLLGPDDELD